MVNPCSHVAAAIHIPETTPYFNSKEVNYNELVNILSIPKCLIIYFS